MKPFKKGKYAGTTFTPEQQRARKIWEHTRKLRFELCEGLRMCGTIDNDRKRLHTRLDSLLDRLEVREREARALFPDVSESFTIASLNIKL